MTTVMTVSEFVKKLKDVEKNYKTLYIMGCFGSPMNSTNKKRYCNNDAYNRQAARTKLINAATTDTFGFDCVCLIKGILWGWNGDKKKTYGGAKYNSNGVPDIGANQMIKVCSEVSTDFKNIEVGEAVWTSGHIGIYIGDGLAIECTPKWKNGVQITACNCKKAGYNTRTWKKHGKLPYIDYTVKPTTTKKPTTTTKPTTSVKMDYATSKDKSLTGAYEVTTAAGLNIRTGASSRKPSLGVLKKGEIVRNYGYYSVSSTGVKWLYVQTDKGGIVGFCSSLHLKKRK